MKNVLERMEENDTKRKVANFQAWQKEDYEFKRAFAKEAAWRFFEDPEINRNCYVAGGHVLDYIGVEWRNPEIYADDYQIKLGEE